MLHQQRQRARKYGGKGFWRAWPFCAGRQQGDELARLELQEWVGVDEGVSKCGRLPPRQQG
eukprot:scaffold9947_cov19-Tisochrysis_lutea.AAC.5